MSNAYEKKNIEETGIKIIKIRPEELSEGSMLAMHYLRDYLTDTVPYPSVRIKTVSDIPGSKKKHYECNSYFLKII